MHLSKLCDYHIHYFMDGCANNEMTFDNIKKEAIKLGLNEICIIKHYSETLPNNKDSWVYWKKIIPEQFNSFLKDINLNKASTSIRILSGVETEIINDTGGINIPKVDAEKLDILLLSVHWLPYMKVIQADPTFIPGQLNNSPADVVAFWHDEVHRIGVGPIIENFVAAYINAIKHNNYPMILAHMYDGLEPLRRYEIPVDELSDNELNYFMEPLMKICTEKHILWELTEEKVKRSSILKKANELGVKFTVTVDAHCLNINEYTNLCDHYKAEEYLHSLALNKGTVICTNTTYFGASSEYPQFPK